MPSQKVTIRSRKYDQSIRREWPCELIEQKGPLLAVVGEFDEDIGSISRGTISYEYFWLDRWYNVFRFHSPRGELLNYYCNISLPPTFEDGVIDYVDLDIDVLVWRDHSYKILDLDEFEVNSISFNYPERVVSNAKKALDELIGVIKEGEFPFAV